MANAARGSEASTARDAESGLRQMALVDRVLGLEAEVARLRLAGDEAERLRVELDEVYRSRTWALGSAMMRIARPRRRTRAR